ncbi:hypothetical protein D3C78_1829460 [compost metagenome]
MQRTQAAERQPGRVEAQTGPDQLGREPDAHEHADDAVDHGHEGEFLHHAIRVDGSVVGWHDGFG